MLGAMTEQQLQTELTWLFQRACPGIIPRSGERGAAVNCYSVEVPSDGSPHLLLRGVQENLVEADEWDGQRFSIRRKVPLSAIDPANVEVTHFYGLNELNFTGLAAFGRARRWRLPYLKLELERFRSRIAQWLFNRRSLAGRERLDVLREIVAAAEESDQAVNAFHLMNRRHGLRWAHHPGWREHHRSLNRLLRGLADTGELTAVNGMDYSPTGFAYRALEDSEGTDRKHRDNFRLQLWIAMLTLAGATMAAVQANVVKLPTLVDFTDGQSQCDSEK